MRAIDNNNKDSTGNIYTVDAMTIEKYFNLINEKFHFLVQLRSFFAVY